jgi:uncharacterized protein YdbL (DUF1318 family)
MVNNKRQKLGPLRLSLLIGLALLPYSGASTQAYAQQAPSVQRAAPNVKLTKELAKQYGLIGELPNGLVGAVIKHPPPKELTSLITNINKGRMIAYKAAAQKSKMPLGYVQLKAGHRLFQMVGPGHYYHKGGKWRMRKPYE